MRINELFNASTGEIPYAWLKHDGSNYGLLDPNGLLDPKNLLSMPGVIKNGGKLVGGAAAAITSKKLYDVIRGKKVPKRNLPRGAAAPKNAGTLNNIKRWKRLKDIQYARVEQKYLVKSATFKLFLKAFDLLYPTLTLYYTLDEIDNEYSSGNIDDEQRNDARTWAFATFDAQFLTPAIAHITMRALFLIKLLNILRRTAGIVSAPASFGISLALLAASEVAIRYFQTWLASSAGQDVLKNTLLSYIAEPAGEFTKYLWESLMKSFSQTSEGKKAKAELDTAE